MLALVDASNITPSLWRTPLQGAVERFLFSRSAAAFTLAAPIGNTSIWWSGVSDAGALLAASDSALHVVGDAPAGTSCPHPPNAVFSWTAVWRIEALLTLARIERQRAGGDAAAAIDALLDEAAAFVDATGALSLAPFVDLERAAVARPRGDEPGHADAVRRARSAFTAMGAHGHAQRLA